MSVAIFNVFEAVDNLLDMLPFSYSKVDCMRHIRQKHYRLDNSCRLHDCMSDHVYYISKINLSDMSDISLTLFSMCTGKTTECIINRHKIQNEITSIYAEIHTTNN